MGDSLEGLPGGPLVHPHTSLYIVTKQFYQYITGGAYNPTRGIFIHGGPAWGSTRPKDFLGLTITVIVVSCSHP